MPEGWPGNALRGKDRRVTRPQGNSAGRLSKISQSINRIQKRAKEIRKELWGAPIFFTLGVLVAEFAFSQIGDNFMYDIQSESGYQLIYIIYLARTICQE